jgi:hypothetical protein
MEKHHINSCVNIRGTSKLFNYYDKIIDNVYDLMNNDPKKLENIWNVVDGIFHQDRRCQFMLGTNLPRESYSCFQCTNISRIADFKKNPLHKPFFLFHGDHSGEQVEIVKYNIRNTKIIFNGCTVKADKFTMEILINFYIQKYFTGRNLNHIVPIYTGFICNNNGYFLRQYHNSINIKELTYDIFVQLLVIFTELSNLEFFNGKLTRNNIVIIEEPISYEYNDIHIYSDYTVKLINIIDSSIDGENVRYCSESGNIKNSIYCKQFKCIDGYYNPIGINKNNKFIRQSYDFYLLISDFSSMNKDSEVLNLWNIMWNSNIVENFNPLDHKFNIYILDVLWNEIKNK